MWKKYKNSLRLPESYISMGLGLLVVLVAGMLLFNFLNKKGGLRPSQNQTNLQNPQAEPATSLPTTHKVENGENLWIIAEKYYHSGYNWVTIAKDNKLSNPSMIEAGQTLNIPAAEVIMPAGVSQPSQGEKIEADSYTVIKGDYLWQIAVRAYGDGYAWVKIAKANNLANPNIIHPGNILKLPR